MSGEARDAAIRDAKRHVAEVVRNDWTFHPSSASSGVPASSTPALPHQPWLGWRLREYDSSGSELEPQLSPTESWSPSSSPLGGGDGARERRRLRRRQDEEEEMRWNLGLRTWVERRDAWTGARSVAEVGALERGEGRGEVRDGDGKESKSRSGSRVRSRSRSRSRTNSGAAGASDSPDLAMRAEASLAIAEGETQLEKEDGAAAAAAAQTLEDGAKESTETNLTVPTCAREESQGQGPESGSGSGSASTAATPPGPNEMRDPLVPVAPSLIPLSNLVRASISPAMYPSIYSKVVVQGLTPTVPINLADLIKAMVQGWKSDGQWPPKPTSIVLQDDSIVHRLAADRDRHAHSQAQGQTSPESKKRSSVASAVKKVFQFSGFHPHPFHRRGSSHGSHAAQSELHDAHTKDTTAGAAPAASSPPGGAGRSK